MPSFRTAHPSHPYAKRARRYAPGEDNYFPYLLAAEARRLEKFSGLKILLHVVEAGRLREIGMEFRQSLKDRDVRVQNRPTRPRSLSPGLTYLFATYSEEVEEDTPEGYTRISYTRLAELVWMTEVQAASFYDIGRIAHPTLPLIGIHLTLKISELSALGPSLRSREAAWPKPNLKLLFPSPNAVMRARTVSPDPITWLPKPSERRVLGTYMIVRDVPMPSRSPSPARLLPPAEIAQDHKRKRTDSPSAKRRRTRRKVESRPEADKAIEELNKPFRRMEEE